MPRILRRREAGIGRALALGLVVASIATVGATADAAQPQSAESRRGAEGRGGTESLPGLDKQQMVRSRMRRLGAGGTVDEVRFDAEGGRVCFRRGREWFETPWDGGEVVSIEESAVPESARVRDVAGSSGRRAARGRQASREPSPDGRLVAEHRDHDVWITDPDGGNARPVTTDGTAEIRYGRASWVYGEELDQDTAMWWSPDARHLAFYRFDDSGVPQYHLLRGLTDLRTRIDSEHYPKAGDPNPVAGLLVHDLSSGGLVEVDVGDEPDRYIYNVGFSPDGTDLLFFRLNRRQDRLELLAADPETGESRVVLVEEQPCWQDHRPEMRFLRGGRRFIWESERTGFAHYELWDLDRGRIAVLTRGDYPVESIVDVDEERGVLHFTARCGEHPLDPQLCRVNLDGTGQRMLTPGDRHYSRFRLAVDGTRFTAVGQRLDEAPRTRLFDEDGRGLATLAEADDAAATAIGLRAPELVELVAADGETPIYASLHFPTDFDPRRRWPLLVEVYGGPTVQAVSNRYRPADPDCEFGFVVARIDNRGTPGRGKAFETAAYLTLGQTDIDDQAAAVRQLLASRDYLDPDRIGINGWSYGGSMVLWGLLRHPELFAAGVSGAPVSDWRNYDTIYTERYMRLPEENPEGYAASSAVEQANRLEGALLLLHGMVDDNVHPANAWQVASRLQALDKPFEMMFFADSGHGVGSPSMQRLRWSFLQRELDAAPGGAPAAAAGRSP